jgi:hypothetical protein
VPAAGFHQYGRCLVKLVLWDEDWAIQCSWPCKYLNVYLISECPRCDKKYPEELLKKLRFIHDMQRI